MTGGEKVLIVGAVVVGGLAFWKFKSGSTSLPNGGRVGPDTTNLAGTGYVGTGIGTGSIGWLAPVFKLPGVAQVYNKLAPVNAALQADVIRPINTSKPVVALNNALGGTVKTTINPNGTVTKTVSNNWYTRNVGSPISHAGTAVVHFIGSL